MKRFSQVSELITETETELEKDTDDLVVAYSVQNVITVIRASVDQIELG